MTPRQCRAARRLLGWSRLRLAAFAGLRDTCVVEFEEEQRMLSPDQIAALRAVLEAEGIEIGEQGKNDIGVHCRCPRDTALERARYLRHKAKEARAAACRASPRRDTARLLDTAAEMEAQAAGLEAAHGVHPARQA
ncbi:hypothetical protein ACE7GA_05680 [Roseomonas sp. CCTCC AB2023176]|uniref:hypothetical protein n=1 Tax=Roseomonas sp. CCTCC AB2023176 TaxID=3342640 RepID=UPI0035DA0852